MGLPVETICMQFCNDKLMRKTIKSFRKICHNSSDWFSFIIEIFPLQDIFEDLHGNLTVLSTKTIPESTLIHEKKSDICLNKCFSNIFETFGKMLTGMQLLLLFLKSILKTGFISACFRQMDNFCCFDTFIKNNVKKISKQIAFPFKIFVSMSCSCVALADFNTGWKVSKYGDFFGPYFLAFGLNTERYEVSLRIQSECGKIRTRKNSVFGHISHSASS